LSLHDALPIFILTGLYTIMGGLRAVAYTEALQTVILVIGSLLVLIYGLDAIGGWDRLYDIVGAEMFDLWKPIVPEGIEATWAPVMEPGRMAWYFNSNYPWVGMLFGSPVVGVWLWPTNHYIVGGAMGGPNIEEGRRATMAAAFLTFSPAFIFIVPGIIAFAWAKSCEIAAIQQAMLNANGELITQEAQAAFPLLVAYVLPVGIRGIVVAGLLAALMSSLAGVFNACSTLFTMDFYSKFRPDSSEEHLVW